MANFTRTTMSLDNETMEQIREIQAQVREALGTKLSRSRVVCAAIRQFHERILKARADG